MRAKEFIKEDPGFDAGGPGVSDYPRGYSVPHQMYPMGNRFDKPVKDFNMDPMDTNTAVHVERIDQRIEGGMSAEQAINSYASQIAVDPNELAELYSKSKSRNNFT